MFRMGLIINPIAGMGGSVGLKGTDGDAYRVALERGAKPIAWKRALEFLNNIHVNNFVIYTAGGEMGYNVVNMSKHRDKVVKIYKVCDKTTAEDTKRVAREMVRDGVDIIVFIGGDGTAKDICEAIDKEAVVLGVPSGVKMYSAVFAVNPPAATRVFEEYIRGRARVVEREVVDIDEDAFRKDELRLKIHCYLKIPIVEEYIQSSKSIISIGDEEENKIAIAKYIVENMERDTVYILGPGTTVKTINKILNIPATILGVDVVYNYELLVKDAWEKHLLEILDRFNKVKIILSPIGGQGFILGRGNQQISPQVLRRIGKNNILIISTWSKLKDLDYLRIDTGDRELDNELEGYYPILVDYNRYVVKKVVSVH